MATNDLISAIDRPDNSPDYVSLKNSYDVAHLKIHEIGRAHV